MYLETFKVGAAARSYRSIDLNARIEGASPHALVVVLFEELLKSMDAMIAAMRRGDYTQRAARQGRALAILQALDTSLDHEAGQDIARDLSLVYRQARKLTMEGSRTNQRELVEQARGIVDEIASAWREIA
jgi:flagellar protein FliS